MRAMGAVSPLGAHLAPFHARASREDDAPFLARLYASTRADLLGDGSADPAFAAALIAMQQRLQLADYRARFPAAEILLLAQDGAPYARIVVDSNAARVRLVDIAVLPEARGHGAGSRILRALQAHAASLSLPLCLSVHRGNAGARRLYLALGFVPDDAGAMENTAAEALQWRAP